MPFFWVNVESGNISIFTGLAATERTVGNGRPPWHMIEVCLQLLSYVDILLTNGWLRKSLNCWQNIFKLILQSVNSHQVHKVVAPKSFKFIQWLHNSEILSGNSWKMTFFGRNDFFEFSKIGRYILRIIVYFFRGKFRSFKTLWTFSEHVSTSRWDFMLIWKEPPLKPGFRGVLQTLILI